MLKLIFIPIAFTLAATGLPDAAASVLPSSGGAAEQEAIVVIGRKLSGWRGKTKMRKGVRTCKTIRSSKDRLVDKIGCDSMVHCMNVLAPSATGLAANAKTKKEAATLLAPYYRELSICLNEQRAKKISELVNSRK